ncbi:long-chain-acyl-CoA synthetase [Limnobacter humi]|uniref:Long-chain-acyl-CoA synthetase n=1 Tax=Limnobacter humi TaxID=1778671 RepID=A0ABT1WI55_9BURK|nr:long-chain-acyl-CoA synthetase [Limnobacter humi]MCQ8897178.1 long-chain-acyl-CoA synthetase [Limnobacter humi]
MGLHAKTVSPLDIARGALSYLPDVPRLLPGLLGLATLRPGSRRSLALVFQNQAARHAQRKFVDDGRLCLTYGQANVMANQMARGLQSLGVRSGDAVGLLSRNRTELLVAVIAVAKLGAVSALLNTNQTGSAQAHSIGLVKPRVIVACDHGLQILKTLAEADPGLLKGCELLGFDIESSHLAFSSFRPVWENQADHNLMQTGEIVAKAPCFYIFTSGTTGLPKASVMSHYRWLQAMCGMNSATRLRETDVFYCCLPLYHNNALTVSLGMVVAAGACFAMDEKFSATRFWSRIRHFQATAFCYIGELLRYLMNQPVSCEDQNHEVRFIVGNGLRPEIWRSFEDRFGIHQIFEFYGASESNLGFMNAFGLRETVGFSPMPYQIVACDTDTEQALRDSKGRCIKVALGEVGLLISEVTTLRPFDGYTDPKANEAKLLRNVFRQGDCWFNSGDLVRRQGFHHIQFVDRLGDTFRWKGENVATSEVEGVLARYPALDHAVVYGVQVSGTDGRAGMAAISLKMGVEPDWQDLARFLMAELPAYALPQYLRVIQQPETTGTFKYQKATLKKEGLDTSRISDPLLRLDTAAGSYVPF